MLRVTGGLRRTMLRRLPSYVGGEYPHAVRVVRPGRKAIWGSRLLAPLALLGSVLTGAHAQVTEVRAPELESRLDALSTLLTDASAAQLNALRGLFLLLAVGVFMLAVMVVRGRG